MKTIHDFVEVDWYDTTTQLLAITETLCFYSIIMIICIVFIPHNNSYIAFILLPV